MQNPDILNFLGFLFFGTYPPDIISTTINTFLSTSASELELIFFHFLELILNQDSTYSVKLAMFLLPTQTH